MYRATAVSTVTVCSNAKSPLYSSMRKSAWPEWQTSEQMKVQLRIDTSFEGYLVINGAVFGVGHLKVLEASLVRWDSPETERRREGRSQHDLTILLREHAKERLQTGGESLPYHQETEWWCRAWEEWRVTELGQSLQTGTGQVLDILLLWFPEFQYMKILSLRGKFEVAFHMPLFLLFLGNGSHVRQLSNSLSSWGWSYTPNLPASTSWMQELLFLNK